MQYHIASAFSINLNVLKVTCIPNLTINIPAHSSSSTFIDTSRSKLTHESYK